MLDRRLMQDDHRGLAEGIKDSSETFESFRLLLERRLTSTNVSIATVVIVQWNLPYLDSSDTGTSAATTSLLH